MYRFLFTYLFCASFLNLSAQGFQVNFQGQKQQGMGFAGTAIFQDASSIFYNAGSIAFSNENSVNVSITPIFANVLYVDSATGGAYRTENPVGTPFCAYGLFQHKKLEKFKFGLGIYTPFGSTVKWEDNWIGRFAITRLKLQAIYIQPTISYRLSKKIGIGGGFIYSKGSVNLQKDIPIQDSLGNYSHVELNGKAAGFGFNLGVNFQVNDKFSMGLSYRSKIKMSVKKGEADFSVPSSLSSNFPNGNFSGTLPLPDVATIGFAYKVSKKWTLAIDINHVGWKSYDTLAFDYALNTSSLLDTKSPREYKNIFAFRGGAEFGALKNLDLRFGGGFGFTPVQDGYLTPETPDANRIYGTLGISYRFTNRFSMDASLYYTHLKRAGRNIETNLNGTFTTKALAPGFSLIYNW
ncbi:MAG: long-chain fatty acid transporter [Flavobacteriales bacterium]|nr:long-chain fatty acid transporter [Flavobacteriales bacterium]